MEKSRITNLITSTRLFYREYTVYNLIFTLIGLYFLLAFGLMSWIWIFWIKVAGYTFLGVLYYGHRKKFLYFFHNLGVTTHFLFISAVCIDSVLTILLYRLFI